MSQKNKVSQQKPSTKSVQNTAPQHTESLHETDLSAITENTPSTLTPAQVMKLQRTVGNQAAHRVIQRVKNQANPVAITAKPAAHVVQRNGDIQQTALGLSHYFPPLFKPDAATAEHLFPLLRQQDGNILILMAGRIQPPSERMTYVKTFEALLESYSPDQIKRTFMKFPDAFAERRSAMSVMYFLFESGYANPEAALPDLLNLRLGSDHFRWAIQILLKHPQAPLPLLLTVVKSKGSFAEADAELKLLAKYHFDVDLLTWARKLAQDQGETVLEIVPKLLAKDSAADIKKVFTKFPACIIDFELASKILDFVVRSRYKGDHDAVLIGLLQLNPDIERFRWWIQLIVRLRASAAPLPVILMVLEVAESLVAAESELKLLAKYAYNYGLLIWAREQVNMHGEPVLDLIPALLVDYSEKEILEVFDKFPVGLASKDLASTILSFVFRSGYSGDQITVLKTLLSRQLDFDGFQKSLQVVLKHAPAHLPLVLELLASEPSIDLADAELTLLAKYGYNRDMLAWAREQAAKEGEAFSEREQEQAELVKTNALTSDMNDLLEHKKKGTKATSEVSKAVTALQFPPVVGGNVPQPTSGGTGKQNKTKKGQVVLSKAEKLLIPQIAQIEYAYQQSVEQAKGNAPKAQQVALDKLTLFVEANLGVVSNDMLKTVWAMANSDEKRAQLLVEILKAQGTEDLLNLKLVTATKDPKRFAAICIQLIQTGAQNLDKMIPAMDILGDRATTFLLQNATHKEINSLLYFLNSHQNVLLGALTVLETIGYSNVIHDIESLLSLKPASLLWLLNYTTQPFFTTLVGRLEVFPKYVDGIQIALTTNGTHQNFPIATVMSWCFHYDPAWVNKCLLDSAADNSPTYTDLAITFGTSKSSNQFMSLIRLQGLLADGIANFNLYVYKRDTNYAGGGAGAKTGFLKCQFANGTIIKIHTHWIVGTQKITSMHVQENKKNGAEINKWTEFVLVQQAIVHAHNNPPVANRRPTGGALSM